MSVSPREFAAFVANAPVKLPTFVSLMLPESIQAEGADPKPFTKDFSPQSLPWVETFAISVLETPAAVPRPENQPLSEGLMRYVGEVFLRHVGGAWDFDPAGEVGDGMPFIRPDSAKGELQGTPISVLGLLMTALTERSNSVFLNAYTQALQGFEGKKPARTSTSFDVFGTKEGIQPPTEDEMKFLATYLPSVEYGVATFVQSQGDTAQWAFNRESLERVGQEVVDRFGSVEKLDQAKEDEWLAGAARFFAEAIRQAGNGAWRYGANFEHSDARAGEAYVQFKKSKLDVVPTLLLHGCFADPTIIAHTFDTVAGLADDTGTA